MRRAARGASPRLYAVSVTNQDPERPTTHGNAGSRDADTEANMDPDNRADARFHTHLDARGRPVRYSCGPADRCPVCNPDALRALVRDAYPAPRRHGSRDVHMHPSGGCVPAVWVESGVDDAEHAARRNRDRDAAMREKT